MNTKKNLKWIVAAALVVLAITISMTSHCSPDVDTELNLDSTSSAKQNTQKIQDSTVKEAAERVEKIAIDAMKRIGIPGAGFVVVRGGKIIHQAYFGKTCDTFRIGEEREVLKNENESKDWNAIDSNTLFPLSSVSKTITGILVGALVDKKQLSWADKVTKYIQSFELPSDQSGKCTILDIISHHAGIKGFYGDSVWSGGWNRQKIISSLKYATQTGIFGKDYGYQNILFGMIGDVASKATGMSFEDLIEQNIFKKLGIKNASVIPLSCEESYLEYLVYRMKEFISDCSMYGIVSATKSFIKKITKFKKKKVSKTHGVYEEVVYPHYEEYDFLHKMPATSGISMSLPEFSKVLGTISNRGSYMGSKIISDESFDKITSKITTVSGFNENSLPFTADRLRDIYYGAGIYTANYCDCGQNPRHIIFHMGGIYGCQLFYVVVPDEDIAFMCACNFGSTAHTLFGQTLAFEFLDRCFGFSNIDWITKDIEQKKKYMISRKAFFERQKVTNMTQMKQPEKYTGEFYHEMYGTISISQKGEDLYISTENGSSKLAHINADTFSFSPMGIIPNYSDHPELVTFIFNNDGERPEMRVSCFYENNALFKGIEHGHKPENSSSENSRLATA